VNLDDQLVEKDLVVFLGPGGVGKTTVSAASALEAADRGQDTLVFTIDPARRLSDALGIDVGSEVTEVRENLDALMLDTKKALDDLVEKYAPSPDRLQRIYESPFYEQLSDAFAGSEEFVAMGALYELLEGEGDWDVVVVDTPPSKHAVDFLDVNRRLIRVFDSGVVKYLFKPTRFLRMGGGYMAKALGKWTSSEYLEEVSDFVVTFDDMFLEMEERVRAMQEILNDTSRTGINLVSSPEEESVPVSQGLHDEVVDRLGLTVDACVVNRHLEPLTTDGARQLAQGGNRQAVAEALAGGPATDEVTAEAFFDDAVEAAGTYQAVADIHAENAQILRDELDLDHRSVPAFRRSVQDIDGLDHMRRELFPG
jgi:anion-transporting  ArsA/GET3 family ATPase